MEAWKNVFTFENIQPVFALSITTERWGLNPFPPNLAVTSGDWSTLVQSNTTIQAWTQPYQCHNPTPNSSVYNATNYEIEYNLFKNTLVNDSLAVVNDLPYLDRNITTISSDSNICSKAQACPSSGCRILITSALKTRAGIKNTKIIVLAHGISAFFCILVLITMAVFSFLGRRKAKNKAEKEYPTARSKVQPIAETRGPRYNPRRPVDGQRPIPPPAQAPTKVNMANEVAKCSSLLREMYALDLIIYGMEKNVDEEAPDRIQKQIKANAIFAEIVRMVNGWKASDAAAWKPQERLYIEEICKVVDENLGRVYPEEVYEPRGNY